MASGGVHGSLDVWKVFAARDEVTSDGITEAGRLLLGPSSRGAVNVGMCDRLAIGRGLLHRLHDMLRRRTSVEHVC